MPGGKYAGKDTQGSRQQEEAAAAERRRIILAAAERRRVEAAEAEAERSRQEENDRKHDISQRRVRQRRIEAGAARTEQNRIIALQEIEAAAEAERRRNEAERRRIILAAEAERRRNEAAAENTSFNTLLNPPTSNYTRRQLYVSTATYKNLLEFMRSKGYFNDDKKTLRVDNPCSTYLKCNPRQQNRTIKCRCCYICNYELPYINNPNDRACNYECDHILPYFSGAAFLGHDSQEEYAYVHATCNTFKKRGDNNDIWGWNILERPYTDSTNVVHRWGINWNNAESFYTQAVNNFQNNCVGFGQCNEEQLYKSVLREIIRKLNNANNPVLILGGYLISLRILACFHSFHNNGNHSDPDQNQDYQTCRNYATNGAGPANGFGSKFVKTITKEEENAAFLRLVKIPSYLKNIGEKQALDIIHAVLPNKINGKIPNTPVVYSNYPQKRLSLRDSAEFNSGHRPDKTNKQIVVALKFGKKIKKSLIRLKTDLRKINSF